MKVKLVSTTKPVFSAGILANMDGEDLIAYCARASSKENQLDKATYPKLLRYLIDNKHWSPFEMVSMCVEITTSRAIAQQILRHRSFSFQEFSQRYARVSAMEPVELRKKSEKNRQSSLLPIRDSNLALTVQRHLESSQAVYDMLLDHDVAKETARMVLPLTTQTTLYMNGTVRSWIHYLQIRCDEHVQKEHREIADRIKDTFTVQFPSIALALWGVDDDDDDDDDDDEEVECGETDSETCDS